MKARNVLLISIIVILLVGIATNPSKEDYITWSKEQLTTLSDNGLEKGLISLVGGPLLRNSTISRNLIFFSIYETSINNDENIKVLGAFRNFIPISSNLQDKYDKQT